MKQIHKYLRIVQKELKHSEQLQLFEAYKVSPTQEIKDQIPLRWREHLAP